MASLTVSGTFNVFTGIYFKSSEPSCAVTGGEMGSREMRLVSQKSTEYK